MSILLRLESFANEFQSKLAVAHTLESLEELRVEAFGKKGSLTEILKELSKLSPEERPKVGAKANEVRESLSADLNQKIEVIRKKQINEKLLSDRIDVSLPGRIRNPVAEHPIEIVTDELCHILESCGFKIELGPEVEHEWFNFDALNIPANHPARAMQDTFYIMDRAEKVILRTQTSPVQIRTMLTLQPPIRMIAPGRVYRSDYDATHSPMFHQVEGLLVDESTNMGDLKGILALLVSEFFGMDLTVRLRPSFFPFTEPSAELDVQCVFCKGEGCKICKQSGFLEVGGCGMVDPEVFKSVGVDFHKYRGFAFGMGVERLAMLKYGIQDLRSFFESDHRFVSQFSRFRS